MDSVLCFQNEETIAVRVNLHGIHSVPAFALLWEVFVMSGPSVLVWLRRTFRQRLPPYEHDPCCNVGKFHTNRDDQLLRHIHYYTGSSSVTGRHVSSCLDLDSRSFEPNQCCLPSSALLHFLCRVSFWSHFCYVLNVEINCA